MAQYGIFHTKTHLSKLVARAGKGERILITHRGKPLAMLGPPPAVDDDKTGNLAEELLAYSDRANRTLGPGLTYRQLRDEGRRI